MRGCEDWLIQLANLEGAWPKSIQVLLDEGGRV